MVGASVMTGGVVTEAGIWDELAQVMDPCSVQLGRPLSLATMGLVEDVVIEGATVRVRLVLTDATCIFYFKFASEIEERLVRLAGVDRVDVSVETTVMWTPERIRSEQLQ